MELSIQVPMEKPVEEKLLGVLRGVGENEDLVMPVISGERIAIGSQRSCDISIRTKTIQKLHCVVFSDRQSTGNDTVYVKDLSRVGTYINEYLIGEKRTAVLYNGCRLTIGHHPFDLIYISKAHTWPPPSISSGDSSESSLSVDQGMARRRRVRAENGKDIIVMEDYTLGSGSQGQIYLAYFEHAPSYQLACKVKRHVYGISNNFSRSQAMREIELLRQCKHPNIIRLIDSQRVGNDLYMFTPLATRGNLEGLLKDRPDGLNEELARHIFVQLVVGLQYLHSHEEGKKRTIIHGDLKPMNILLCDRSQWPRVVISDLGVALYPDEMNELANVGTLAYRAPEIFRKNFDQDLCIKVDYWALGIVLYQLLSGQYPFDVENPEELDIAIKELEPAYKEASWQNVSIHAQDVVKALLRKDPATRLCVPDIYHTEWISRHFSEKRILMYIRGTWQELFEETVIYKAIYAPKKAINYELPVPRPKMFIPDNVHRRELTAAETRMVKRLVKAYDRRTGTEE